MLDVGVVTQWLEQQDIHFEDAADKLVDPGEFAWAILARTPVGHSSYVAARDVEWNDVRIDVVLDVSEEHIQVLRELEEGVRIRFYFDLRGALLMQTAGYRLVFEEGDGEGILTRMHFGIRLLEDEITKAGFFRRHHQVQNSAILAVNMIRKLVRFREW